MGNACLPACLPGPQLLPCSPPLPLTRPTHPLLQWGSDCPSAGGAGGSQPFQQQQPAGGPSARAPNRKPREQKGVWAANRQAAAKRPRVQQEQDTVVGGGVKLSGIKAFFKPQAHQQHAPPQEQQRPASQASQPGGGGGRPCFKCGQAGHWAAGCPNR